MQIFNLSNLFCGWNQNRLIGGGASSGCPVFRSPFIRKLTQVASLAIVSTYEEQRSLFR